MGEEGRSDARPGVGHRTLDANTGWVLRGTGDHDGM